VGPLPSSVARAIEEIGLAGGLDGRVRFLAADLVDYQDSDYALSFVDFVARVASAERSVHEAEGRSAEDDQVHWPLTEAVVNGLHKLMAYKDEYEVARLLISTEATVMAESVGGPGARVTWRLHPPLLRALGVDSKIGIDQRVGRPMMKVLARGKKLRGTALDPFGRAKVRRVERALIQEYRSALERLLARLDASSMDEALAVARAAMDVKGYEDIKLDRAQVFRSILRAVNEHPADQATR